VPQGPKTGTAKPTPPKPQEPEAPAGVPKPDITQRPIPFPQKRKDETAAYAQRHYGLDTYRLEDPHVIVEHYTVTPDFESTFNTFAPDNPDVELHELPGVCSHFVIDKDGTIYQLVPLSIMCRHTVGLNYTSFGIEHVGNSDAEVTGDKAQIDASYRLTRWLRCTYDIKVANVIGHNESLSSPFHMENVAKLKTQTHGDMSAATMGPYRDHLKGLGC
jgi:beta-N-acetylhexosaminidase